MNSNAPSLKQIIASNLNLLMEIYSKSRKEVCSDLDLSYTTFCDWVNARTYPRMDALETISHYFRISTRDMLIDLSRSQDVLDMLSNYADTYGIALDNDDSVIYSSDYPHPAHAEYPVELIRGDYFVYEAPASIHQHIIAELCLFIGHFIKKEHTGHRLYPGPFSVEFPTTPESVVVPDLTIIHGNSGMDEYGYSGTPDWIIEVVSPTTRNRDQYVKKALYEEMGVLEYWIIDPYRFDVIVYTLVPSVEPHYRARTYLYSETIASNAILGLTLRMVDLDILG